MKLAPFTKAIGNLSTPLTLRQWLSLLLICLAVFFAALPWLRLVKFDATADRLFTLSSGTKQVLGRIGEPITFKLYYSEQLGRVVPAYASYATRVTDLLRELQQQAHGKIKLEIVNPIPFSEEEDRAIAYGLKAVPISQQESVFFGMVATNSLDAIEGVPFFQPDRETFLEYDLARLIERLTRKQKPVVGLFSGLPIMGDTAGLMAGTPTQPWIIYNQLSRDYDVRLIASDGAGIDENLDMLIIVQPRNITEQAIFKIDQFALRKGRIMAMLDPLPETELGGLNIGRPPSYLDDGLLALFRHWGVTVSKDQIVLDPATARQITLKQGEGAVRTNYLPWLGIGSGLMKRDDLMTSDLSALNFASAGFVEPVEGASTQFTPLVTSSDKASLLPRTELRNLSNPDDLYNKQSAAGKKLPLIARVTGSITSLYSDQPNNPFVKQAGQGFVATGSQDLRMVVIADSDFLANDQWLEVQEFYGQVVGQPKANNGDLLFNVLDNLVGSDALTSLRSRGTSLRPFDRVNKLQAEAENRFREQEKRLQEQLKDTEDQLAKLQTGQQNGAVGNAANTISAEQNAAVQRFRAEVVATRKQLRQVQAALQADLQNLKVQLLLICTLLVPAILLTIMIVKLLLVKNRRAAWTVNKPLPATPAAPPSTTPENKEVS